MQDVHGITGSAQVFDHLRGKPFCNQTASEREADERGNIEGAERGVEVEQGPVEHLGMRNERDSGDQCDQHDPAGPLLQRRDVAGQHFIET